MLHDFHSGDVCGERECGEIIRAAPSGDFVVAASDNYGGVIVLDVKSVEKRTELDFRGEECEIEYTGDELQILSFDEPASALAISPDSQLIAVALADGELSVF